VSDWVVSLTVLAPGEPGALIRAAESALADLDPLVVHLGSTRYNISVGLEGFLDQVVTDAIVTVSRAVPQIRIVKVEAVTLDEYVDRRCLPLDRMDEVQPTAAANPRHNQRLLSALAAMRDHHPATGDPARCVV
jgi:hypothetical protein